MFTKILITVAVITISIVVLRNRRNTAPTTREVTIKVEEPDEIQWMIKWVAYGLVTLILLTGTVIYYLDWKEDHRLYDIRIINPQTGKIDEYQAYKKDMYGRSFITLTGERVAASELERIEFIEAE